MKLMMDNFLNGTNKCLKFEPNVFNKSKCQACFRGKDEHSAQALENNKISRKILLCDYFFVAPSSFDFDNPLDRTRRWQRRLFVLYDDGELTYSIDENVNTVPQGSINVNTSQEISSAEEATSHLFSIVVVSNDGNKTFIKGATKEETERLRNRLNSIVDGAKPAKVKRNFTISHSPSSDLERKLAHSTTNCSGSLRNHFLSHPSLSVPNKPTRSNRVLSEISNRSINQNGVTPTHKNNLHLITDVVDSGEYQTDRGQRPPTYRNMRRLKNRTLDRPGPSMLIRKSLSLQTLNDGNSSDLDGDILMSNSSARDSENQNSDEPHLSPPDLFMNLPENAPNVTVRASRSRKKHRRFGRKNNQENVDGQRSRSLCHERDQFPKGGSVLGAIRFWEERSRSCEALKTRRNVMRSNTISNGSSFHGIDDDCDNQSSDSYDNVPCGLPNSFRNIIRPLEYISSETLKNQSRERLHFEEFSLDELVLQNINSQSLRENSLVSGLTNHNVLKSDFPDQSFSRSSSLMSIGLVDNTTNENHWIDNNKPFQPHTPTSSTNTSRLSGCTWPYSSPSSPDSNFQAEENNQSNILRDFEGQSTIELKLEETQNDRLNKQNVISVVMADLYKLVRISPISNNNQHSLSEVQKVLKELNEFVSKINSEKTELEAALQRADIQSTPCLADARIERDSLLQKVDDLWTKISNLEKDLLDEKLCRESARKSFLKELSDHKIKSEEDKMMIRNLQEDIECLKVDQNNASSLLTERNAKISILIGDLSKFEEKLKEASSHNNKLTSSCSDYEQQICDLTITLDLQSKRLLALEDETRKLMSENDELNVKLEFQVAEKCCLTEELERLTEEFVEVEKERNSMYEQRNVELSCQNVFSEDDPVLCELKEYTKVLENENMNHQKSLDELRIDHHEKVLQLECQVGELAERLKASEKNFLALNNSSIELECDFEKLNIFSKKVIRSDEAIHTNPRSVEIISDHCKISELEKTNSILKQQLRKLEVELEDAKSSSSLKVQELSKKLNLEQRRYSRFCDSLRRLGCNDQSEDLAHHLESLVDELERTKIRLQEAEERELLLHQKFEAKEELVDIKAVKKVSESFEAVGSVSGMQEEESSEALHVRIRQLEQQLRNIQVNHQRELEVQRSAHRREMMMSREETLRRLADAEATCMSINEDNIRKKYSKDVNKIKDMYNKGFHSLEKSQQQSIEELKKNHSNELERLHLEKEQLLKEEVAATQSALDVMRKAHEAELGRERIKFLDKIAQTVSPTDMRALQRKHEQDMKFIQVEIRQLSEQYSIKCLENASLNEMLKQHAATLHESRKRVQDLLERNEELLLHVGYDNKSQQLNDNLSSLETRDGKYLLDLREVTSKTEILKLREQLKNTHLRLDGTLEELNDCRDKYGDLKERMKVMHGSSDSDSFRQVDDLCSTIASSDWSINELFCSEMSKLEIPDN